MCGIAGFFPPDRAIHAHGPRAAMLDRMGMAIARRGPDAHGQWHDAETGIGLAHRRLAVLDLSDAGHQPMRSQSDRFVLVFNGEIYNHLSLRERLDMVVWRGHSDTETLLAGFDVWGISRTLEQTVGMFALAVWDRAERVLTLARDRMGEKPLYYGWQGGTFLFGSELQALRAHPSFQGRIDRCALDGMLRTGYVGAPSSIYEGIRKLPPGTTVSIGAGRSEEKPLPYWSVVNAVRRGKEDPLPDDPAVCLDQFEKILRTSVGGQMIADVPVGAFLSGGIDSSLVVAMMQTVAREPVRTFTIGFDEPGFDEADHARAVAAHLGTRHTELYVSAREAMDIVPRIPDIYTEPFADASQIPMYLVSELARRQVTVCLSGDGADELFAGYTRYFWTGAVLRGSARIPAILRRLAGWGMASLSRSALHTAAQAAAALGPGAWRYSNAEEKLSKLARLLSAGSAATACRDANRQWSGVQNLVQGSEGGSGGLSLQELDLHDIENRMMEADQLDYLPDDILAKVDRAAMAVSLEARVPMLDHRLVEFAWRLPLSLKIRERQGKWLLRQALYRHVPQALVDRPKMGFSVPIDRWLKGPLREWAEGLLDPVRLARQGWLCPEPVTRAWNDHKAGRRNTAAALWGVLMFQQWLEREEGR